MVVRVVVGGSFVIVVCITTTWCRPTLTNILTVGINYVGQQGQLSGCHNDVGNIKKYLIEHQGFREQEMLILMDDGRHHSPTKRNIEDAFKRITEYSQAGDTVFVHYSGHVRMVGLVDCRHCVSVNHCRLLTVSRFPFTG